jgi:hypothetical protein
MGLDYSWRPLLHEKTAALLRAELELFHGSSFGCLKIRRGYEPEILHAFSDERYAPRAEPDGGNLVARGWHCRSLSHERRNVPTVWQSSILGNIGAV